MNLMQKLKGFRVRKVKYLILILMVFSFTYNFFGVHDYIFTKSFEKQFRYPLDIDLRPLAEKILEGADVSAEPINRYPHSFLTMFSECDALEKVDLVILVKSAMDHYHHRSAIRHTFGLPDSVPGMNVKTLFFVGIDDQYSSDVQIRVDLEMRHNQDIIQMDFIDSYYSNTNKTMMAFRWAYENCPFADYYLFTDDDMYVNIRNLLDYARYGDAPIENVPANTKKDVSAAKTESLSNIYADNDKILYAGYVINSAPIRIKSSKWVVSLNEYPWNKWPPYVTAGAYILSNKALKLIYIGSQFVKHFKFDDIYLGIVAMKLNIKLTHCSRFHYYKKVYTKEGYKDVIASHGFGDQEELITTWKEQMTNN